MVWSPELAKPVIGPVTTPGGAYGPRMLDGVYNFHNGLDFSYLYADVAGSTVVRSAHPGTVTNVGYSAEAGRYITVRVDDRWLVRYIHLVKDSARVIPGQRVGYGTHLATMGNSGTVYRHLHFDLFDMWKTTAEKRVDPAPHITLPYGYTGVVPATGGESVPLPPRKAPTMYFIRTQDGTISLVTDNGIAAITQMSHLDLFKRLFASYPSWDTFNTIERDIMHGYIKAANTADDAETAKILAALAAVPKPVVDNAAIIKAVQDAIAAQDVVIDLEPVLTAIEAVNANIDDQPTEFVLTPKEA